MGDSHGRVGGVDALSPGSGRAVDVDLEVVLIDLDLDLLGLGHDRDRRRRGVDAPLRLGDRNALDTVRSSLPLEDRVGAVALDGEGDLVEPARLVRVRAENLGLETAPLGIARQHAEEVSGPDRALVSAGPLADLDDDVPRVLRIALDEGRLQLLLKALEPFGELRHEIAELRIRARRLQVVTDSAPILREPVWALELLQAASRLCGRLAIGEDGGITHALLRVGVRALELVDQVLDRRGHRPQAMTSTWRSSGVRRPSRRSTSRRARIETSIWSSVGSRVVSRCSQSPGARSPRRAGFCGCLPAKRITS